MPVFDGETVRSNLGFLGFDLEKHDGRFLVVDRRERFAMPFMPPTKCESLASIEALFDLQEVPFR